MQDCSFFSWSLIQALAQLVQLFWLLVTFSIASGNSLTDSDLQLFIETETRPNETFIYTINLVANDVWLTAHRFGQFWRNSSTKSGNMVSFSGKSIVGEIERQIFGRTLCAGDFSINEKSLVKLTPGVNFINILHTNFSYERRFFYVHVTRKSCQNATFNVDEIDPWSKNNVWISVA